MSNNCKFLGYVQESFGCLESYNNASEKLVKHKKYNLAFSNSIEQWFPTGVPRAGARGASN